jgi:hypothetical protein
VGRVDWRRSGKTNAGPSTAQIAKSAICFAQDDDALIVGQDDNALIVAQDDDSFFYRKMGREVLIPAR